MAVTVHILPRSKLSLQKLHLAQGHRAEVTDLKFKLGSTWTLLFSTTLSTIVGWGLCTVSPLPCTLLRGMSFTGPECLKISD